MSAGIAHEINNPLAIIAGSIGQLQKLKESPEKFAAKIAALQKSTERIAKIVSGLRKYARASGECERKPAVLAGIVRDSIILVDAKAKRGFCAIEIDLATNAQIDCDEVEIEQVVVNLVNNAIDAVQDQPERWVRVSVFEEPGAVVLQVRDAGPKIAPEIEEKLFQPFFTTKRVGDGTGLGLSITKGILDEHQASIGLRPGDDRTCFEIRFRPALGAPATSGLAA
jgi:C4-dicarboxylate-specific signal transduction histidine kinase